MTINLALPRGRTTINLATAVVIDATGTLRLVNQQMVRIALKVIARPVGIAILIQYSPYQSALESGGYYLMLVTVKRQTSFDIVVLQVQM